VRQPNSGSKKAIDVFQKKSKSLTAGSGRREAFDGHHMFVTLKSHIKLGAIFVFCLLLALVVAIFFWAIFKDPRMVFYDIRRQLNFQFSASQNFMVFPVFLLPSHEVGFVWIDRATHAKKLIHITGYELSAPSISDDGQRLLFIKYNHASGSREIVRCAISSWTCKSLFGLNDAADSPIEVGERNVLFAASPLTRRSDGQERYEHFDFFYFDAEIGAVSKLSDFKFYTLGAFQYVGSKIFFWARPHTIGKVDTETYSADFDENGSPKVIQNVKPVTLLDGLSIFFSCSERCDLAAFLHLAGPGYDLAIAKSGAVAEIIKTKARGVSRPNIVDGDILVNEMFDNEYVVSAYRLGKPSEIMERLSSSPQALEKLEAIILSWGK
jgi:hypothetical protein